MNDRDVIQAALRRLSQRLRLVRAVTAGSRFLVAGLVLSVPPLLVKGAFPTAAPWAVVTAAGAGITLIGAVLTLLGNLVADLLYVAVDPRMRKR